MGPAASIGTFPEPSEQHQSPTSFTSRGGGKNEGGSRPTSEKSISVKSQ